MWEFYVVFIYFAWKISLKIIHNRIKYKIFTGAGQMVESHEESQLSDWNTNSVGSMYQFNIPFYPFTEDLIPLWLKPAREQWKPSKPIYFIL